MSSLNNLFERVQNLNEAKVSPVGKQAPVFKDVPKQMRAAGMAASSRDAMIFITQVLSRLDIISPEAYEYAIKGQHKERMDKLMAILRSKEDEINEKQAEIVAHINDNLDNYTSGAGSDRNRTEKYKETAKKISKEVSNIAAGKEADDGLRDILHFVNDTMQDMDIQKSEDDTPETGPVRAAVDSVMAGLRKEAQDDPDSIPPYVIEDLEEFVPKIMTLDQYKSFVQQLGKFSQEDQYYEKPVLHFMDSVKAVEDGIAANLAAAEDGEHGEDPGPWPAADHDAPEGGIGSRSMDEVEDAEVSIKQEVLTACKERAEEEYQGLKSAGMAKACEDMYNKYGEEGDQEKAEIALSQQKYYETQAKFEARENEEGKYDDGDNKDEKCDYVPCEDEEVVAESKYTTADYLTDIYATVKPIVETTVNENGQTTPTQQYLVEKHEEAIEEVYTNQYLSEQKEQDSLIVPKEKSESFKERFQPKTSYQLDELRRYGL